MSFTQASRKASFAGLLSSGAGAAVLPAAALSVLATHLIADFDIGRGQFGLLAGASAGVSAISSPFMGRLTDRLGGRRSLLGVFGMITLSLWGLASAPTFVLALVAAVTTGLGVAWAGPATNKLVTDHIPSGRRGVITGVKQSGEMVAFMVAGLLPILAASMGWRGTIVVVALFPLVSIAWTLVLLPAGVAPPSSSGNRTKQGGPLPPDVRWLAGYSALMGLGAGSIVAYLALYSTEGVGLSPSASGIVVLVTATVAGVARVLWCHGTERAGKYRRSLAWMSAYASMSVIVLWAASVFRPGLVWLGAIGFGASGLSFAALGMLAAMAASDEGSAGRATGLVSLGFSGGISLGPPVFGFVTDASGGYTISLWGAALALMAAVPFVLLWGKRSPASF